jgi:hypothetical protein
MPWITIQLLLCAFVGWNGDKSAKARNITGQLLIRKTVWFWFVNKAETNNLKVKVTLQQATKAQSGSRGISLLFL